MFDLIRRAVRSLRRAPLSIKPPPPRRNDPEQLRGWTKRPLRDLYRQLDRLDTDRPAFEAGESDQDRQDDCYAEAYATWLGVDFPFEMTEALDKGEWVDLVDLLFEADIRAKWLAERYAHFTRKGA